MYKVERFKYESKILLNTVCIISQPVCNSNWVSSSVPDSGRSPAAVAGIIVVILLVSAAAAVIYYRYKIYTPVQQNVIITNS